MGCKIHNGFLSGGNFDGFFNEGMINDSFCSLFSQLLMGESVPMIFWRSSREMAFSLFSFRTPVLVCAWSRLISGVVQCTLNLSGVQKIYWWHY